ncbi:helix-turn-helix domain-containing protein [Tautonia plasticadhaerens]|uniref:Helix-turn-helix domain protein n=1 Tax=Tautonia plasticadhaerens TaxID=2527974 RepID=A0A518H1C9_9BACT|nr:helix-turn-helix domain-containing protein [Tautonia plasticadhaerens]QDV34654.1 Helix-turn-helix domain protein [Tautonia plasticadhaerens]
MVATRTKTDPRRRADGAPYTVAEAAERQNVSRSVIYEAIGAGTLRAYAIGRGRSQRRYRIEERDLLAWWASLRVGPEDAGGVIRDHLA